MKSQSVSIIVDATFRLGSRLITMVLDTGDV